MGRSGNSWDGARVALAAQAGYYLTTGLWPLLHLRSFEIITGRKPDRFAVESAGALFFATGVTLAVAAARWPSAPGVAALSSSVPIASTVVTLRHRPRLRAVYLLDAGIQCALALWRGAARPSRTVEAR